MDIPLRLLELVISKVCHDLISPVSAINNGVELITEVGGDVIEEANKLIATSAEQAARRLKLFRMCYGRAGNETSISHDDFRAIAEDHFRDTKIKLEWAREERLEVLRERKGGAKMFLNLLLLAEEVMPYGGTVTIHTATAPDRAINCRIEAAGRGAALAPASLACLEGRTPVEEVVPRTVHAAITSHFAGSFDFVVKTDTADAEKVRFWLETQAQE